MQSREGAVCNPVRVRRLRKSRPINDGLFNHAEAQRFVNITEYKGLISLKNLIQLANVSGYLSELKNIFSEPKFSTIEELEKIRKNSGKKKAYKSPSCNDTSQKTLEKK